MNKVLGMLLVLTMAAGLAAGPSPLQAQALAPIQLNAPQTDTGSTVLQALRDRKSVRSFADKPLTLQDLSNILWAADGISRPDGRRTAPSANNVQEFDIYVITADGVYIYDPKQQELAPVVAGDYRKFAGIQGYVATAPLNLIYVADLAKIKLAGDEADKLSIAQLDVGFIAENVALGATSLGLASVPRAAIDKEQLGPILKLRPDQRIILGQTVGYPQ